MVTVRSLDRYVVRYVGRVSVDRRDRHAVSVYYRPTIGRLSTDISTDISEAFRSTSSRPLLSEVTVKYRRSIGEAPMN